MTDLVAQYVKVSDDLVLCVTVDRYDYEHKADGEMIRGEVTGAFVRKGKLSQFEDGA